MTWDEKFMEFVKSFEGCKLEAYRDSAGVPTIGVGHTAGVEPGDVWTQEKADFWLDLDLKRAHADVIDLVRVPMSDGEHYALVDFVFNLGHGALYGSTLLKKLNKGDYSGASLEFPKWNKVRINGKLTVSPGLTRRRLAEQRMFLNKPWEELRGE